MDKDYDLFKLDQSGEKVWIETVTGLDKAKARLDILSSFKPATYLIYDPLQGRFVEPFRMSAAQADSSLETTKTPA
jgi:hypothetical protein